MENFVHSEQKIQYRYILTPDGIKEKIQVTAAFIDHKQAEYEKILQEIDEARQTMQNWKWSSFGIGSSKAWFLIPLVIS